MAEPTTFTIGDVQFTVRRLKPKVSLSGLRLVGKLLLPALAEARSAPSGQVGNAMQKVVEGLDCLPELLDLFSAAAKFQSSGDQGSPKREAPTELKAFVDDVFEGHPEWVVEFIAQCVMGEYAGFLAANGFVGEFMKQASPTQTTGSTSPSTSKTTG